MRKGVTDQPNSNDSLEWVGPLPRPQYAWIFNDTQVSNLVSPTPLVQLYNSTFADRGYSLSTTEGGVGLLRRQETGGSPSFDLGVIDTGSNLPVSAVTIAVGVTKLDDTARGNVLFEHFTNTDTARMYLEVPAGDSQAYWDFGGTSGANRLIVSAATLPPRIGYKQWVVTNDLAAGRRTMWNAGRLLAQATTTGVGDRIPNGSGYGMYRRDFQVTHYLYIWPQALPDHQCQWISAEPYSQWSIRPRRSYTMLSAAAFNPAWAVGSNQYLGGGLHA